MWVKVGGCAQMDKSPTLLLDSIPIAIVIGPPHHLYPFNTYSNSSIYYTRHLHPTFLLTLGQIKLWTMWNWIWRKLYNIKKNWESDNKYNFLFYLVISHISRRRLKKKGQVLRRNQKKTMIWLWINPNGEMMRFLFKACWK